MPVALKHHLQASIGTTIMMVNIDAAIVERCFLTQKTNLIQELVGQVYQS